ncbi:DUF2249 domain-containing protein [Ramlibacter sp.]|uniref:DUF2249 domain-containing protein n=1 Tax=Ramlibacter sp. TaxID=1917967 RepID=UPI002D39CB9C|nr:DUF2249 domain-containing protein [Ramlibacter sp.]HYD76955.1 DUF2249 domain-containing protein [Ramlibacter sp.]
MTTPASRIDVRTIAPRERHALIFSTFDALSIGQALELVNDHDPRPLYYQFNDRTPGQFEWNYLEQGPDTWRVAITRLKAPHGSDGSCCGSCGG